MQAKRLDDWMGDKDVSQSAIKVDFAQSRDGIAAALRRAFREAASEPSAHDFEALLARLN
jgi:hypothetical protein